MQAQKGPLLYFDFWLQPWTLTSLLVMSGISQTAHTFESFLSAAIVSLFFSLCGGCPWREGHINSSSCEESVITVKGQEVLAKILQVISKAKSEHCCLKGWRDEFNKCPLAALFLALWPNSLYLTETIMLGIFTSGNKRMRSTISFVK